MGPLVLLAVGCSTSTSSQPDSPSSSASRPDASGTTNAACRDTAPVRSDSVPAAVRDFDRKRKWHGAADLWVAKPRLLDHTDEHEEGYRTKYASITLDAQGRVTDQKGAPHVDAKRLDRPGSARGSTGGFATADGDRQWWPTVINFPEPGCWKVTETLGSTEVRFTVHVPAL
ncbi:hypothetical protein ABZ357_25865 [Streptomyces sp. NPDC005917]|uniref:hypothetical protein n=1 Tax=unclassified Streptomyces TaxID=2593676 RepID=UPI0033CBE617